MKLSVIIIRRKGIDRLVSVDIVAPEDEAFVVENATKNLGDNYEVEVWRREVLKRVILPSQA